MARHFFRLELALIGSAFGRGWQHALGLVAGLALGVPVAVSIAIGLAFAARTDVGPSVLVGVFAVLTLGWLLAPVLFFGVDETLDPARLQLLPLTPRQLLAGLTVAGAVGVPALATLVVLSAGLAYAGGPAGVPVVVVAVATQFLICLWGGRALATALSATLRSRKGRDIAAVAAMVAGLGLAGVGQLPNLLMNVLDRGQLGQFVEQAASVVALTPPGWAASAIVAAGQGRQLAALGWLAAALLLALGLASAWHVALQRTLSRPDVASATAGKDEPLFPGWLRWLPRGHLGAATAKEFRYLARVPQLRIGLGLLGVFVLAIVVGVVLLDDLARPEVVYAGALLAALQGFQAINLFGHDRGAVWLLMASGATYRADLAGKGVAHVVATFAVVAPVSLLLAGLVGGWGHVLPAIALAAALLASAHGVGALASVLAPHPMPEGATNLWGSSAGMGCSTMLLQFLAFMVQTLLIAPAAGAVAAAHFLAPGFLPLAALFAAAYGAAIWAGWVVLAAARLDTRAPEFVTALSADYR